MCKQQQQNHTVQWFLHSADMQPNNSQPNWLKLSLSNRLCSPCRQHGTAFRKHASSNNNIPEYRFRNLETQLQEGASGRRGTSGTVLPEARGFLGPFRNPILPEATCRKRGGGSVCGSEAPASRTPETPLRKFIQISDVHNAGEVWVTWR
jgi:hypothetical protein